MSEDLIHEVEEFWDRRPCNIRHSTEPVGTKKYFDEVEKRKYFVEPHIPKFARFERWGGAKVLEIGCGIGTDSINFARHGADLTCVDISGESLNICRKRFEVYGLRARFYKCNSEYLSSFVPVEKYDLIYSFGVIHHVPNPYEVLKEIKKFCHKDTEIRVMVYAKWSFKVFSRIIGSGKWFKWSKKGVIKSGSEAQKNCPITYAYSLKDVKTLFKDYKIIDIYKDHIFPYKIKDYIEHKYRKVLLYKLMPVSLFKFLERKFGWHIMVVVKPKPELMAQLPTNGPEVLETDD
ncbi:MAG: class I SAM-dependent methyltransferase [Planctomycetes bacterium]|nr:class I SAM-dependent methyltransferase [Planctomycetota bacterium]